LKRKRFRAFPFAWIRKYLGGTTKIRHCWSKNAYRKPIIPTKLIHSKQRIALDGTINLTSSGDIEYSGFTFLNPEVCEVVLCNYSKLKEDSWGNFENDTWYMINDFE
jgi:hypothetical protein